MSNTVDIGAARVHLIVDAADYDAAIARAKNSAHGFGTEAEQAFDKASGGVRRSARSLLEYVANLGKTSDQLRLLRAAQQGVDHSIIDAAAAAMNDYRRETEAAAAAQRALAREAARAFDEATDINSAFDRQRAANAQSRFDSEYGVDAPQRTLQYLEEQQRVVRALTLQAELREKAEADIANQIARAADEARELNNAFDQQRSVNAQQNFNGILGVDQPRSGAYLAEQQRVVGALTAQFNQLDTAIDEAFAHNAAVERFRQQLVNIQQTAGKTHYEILQLKADQLGVGASFAPLIKGIKDQDAAMGHAGITAKQYEFALRGVPAQITDIAVSLVSGQPAYLVALQQGGQLKDMFGGIAPAARALTSELVKMINPWTVSAAVIGVAAYAAYDAARSMEELAIATAKGDQIAGTADELYRLADALNEIDGVTLGVAEDAVARLASGGKLAGENFNLAAEATARWVALTGEAADGVASKFEAIAKGPLEAIESGQIRVTQAQYDHIRSLVQTGQQQQAVNDLTKIYYDTVNNNSASVEAHLSGVTRYWTLIKDNIGGATRELGDFVNGIADYAVRYEKTFQRLVAGGRNQYIAQFLAFDADAAEATAVADAATADPYKPDEAKRNKERIDALAQWEATADKAAQRRLQLNKLTEEGNKLGMSTLQIQAVLQRQEKQWAEQDAKSNKTSLSSGRTDTQAIRDRMAAELSALQTQTRAVEIQYQQRTITVEDYYDKLLAFAERERDITIQGNNDQIKALAGKKDEERQVNTLRSQNQRAEEAFQRRKMDLDAQEIATLKQRAAAYRDYVQTLNSANDALSRQMDSMVARVSMGDRQFAMEQAINQVYRDQVEQLREIQNAQDDGSLSAGEAEQRRLALYEKTAEGIQMVIDGYDRLAQAEGNWLNGVTRAWENWLDRTRDVAGQTEDLFSSALDGFVDRITEATTGAEVEFKDYLMGMYRDIMRFIAQQQLTKWLESLSNIGNGEGNTGDGAGGVAGLISAFASLFGKSDQYTGFSKGGVPGGVSAYRNQIVSQPKVFPFAKGGVPNFGIMGERSGRPHEAIMPLVRTSGGELGVRSTGGGAMTVYAPTTIQVEGTPNRRTVDQIASKTGQRIQRVTRRNGQG